MNEAWFVGDGANVHFLGEPEPLCAEPVRRSIVAAEMLRRDLLLAPENLLEYPEPKLGTHPIPGCYAARRSAAGVGSQIMRAACHRQTGSSPAGHRPNISPVIGRLSQLDRTRCPKGAPV